MKNYRPLVRPVISTHYHGRKVTTTSAPTSGPALLSVLNIIEPYFFNITGPTPLTIHHFIEAIKYGYAFRTEIGDPDFIHNQGRIDEIISKEWADKVRKNITDVSYQITKSNLLLILLLRIRRMTTHITNPNMKATIPMEQCISLLLIKIMALYL
jgi:gamma-glutamyltranspeptidase